MTYGEWRYSSIILNLGTKWRWMVSFTHLSLYLRGNSRWYTMHRRLGWATEPIWTLWRMGKYLVRTWESIPDPTVVQRTWYTDWTIRAPTLLSQGNRIRRCEITMLCARIFVSLFKLLNQVTDFHGTSSSSVPLEATVAWYLRIPKLSSIITRRRRTSLK
jgi:hypothetical protein